MKSLTKDEMFMIRLLEEAQKLPEMTDPIDRYYVGTLAGLQSRGVDTICNLLIKANFIKKKGEIDITITPHGARLAQSLKDQK